MVTQSKPLSDPEDQKLNELMDKIHSLYPALPELDPQQTSAALGALASVAAMLLARIEIKAGVPAADQVQDQLVQRLCNDRPALVKIALAASSTAPATTLTAQ